MTEIELLEYKIKQLIEDNKSAWSTVRATENARVKAEKERDQYKQEVDELNRYIETERENDEII